MGVSFTVVLVIPVLFFLLGLILFGWAYRGRRSGSHTACRACAYDVTGIAQGVSSCPECGADLSKPNAVTTGAQRRRPLALAVAVLLMLLGGGTILAALAPAAFRNQPTWMLRLEAGGGGRVAVNAMAEIENRRRAGSLDASTVKEIATDLLVRQNNTMLDWTPAMGEFVAGAVRDGVLTQEQAVAFYSTGVPMSASLRGVVREGSQTSLAIRFSDARMAAAGRYEFATADIALKFTDAGGKVVECVVPETKLAFVVLQGGANGGYSSSLVLDVPPGEYTLEGRATVVMRAPGLTEPVRRVAELLPGPIRVVGAGEPVVELATGVNSPEGTAVAQALTPTEVRVRKGRLWVLFRGQGVPVSVVGSLMAEQQTAEGVQTIELLDMAMEPGVGAGQPSGYENDAPKGLAPGRVRLWFEPDIARAEVMVGVNRIWGERIELGNVVITGE